VSPSGNDSAAGTKAAPWRTIAGAAGRMAPGDVAYLRDGTYPDRATIKASGTASALLSFFGYPGEKPLLTNTSGISLSLTGAYVRVDHLRFTNTTQSAAVAIVAGAHDIHLTNCEIFNAGTSGLFVSGDNNEVSGNWIHNNGSRAALDHGMYVEGANNLIRGNRINDNWAYGIQLYNGYGRTAGGNIVELNYIYHNGYGSPTDDFSRYNSAIIVAGAQPDTIIRYNRLCANMHFAVYITDSETGTQLTGNLSCYNPGGAFFLEGAGRTTLSGNVSYNDGGYALMGVTQVTSDQNTFYRAASPPMFQWNGKTDTFAQYRNASGQDAHSTLDDPHVKSVSATAFDPAQALTYDLCTPLIPQLCAQ